MFTVSSFVSRSLGNRRRDINSEYHRTRRCAFGLSFALTGGTVLSNITEFSSTDDIRFPERSPLCYQKLSGTQEWR